MGEREEQSGGDRAGGILGATKAERRTRIAIALIGAAALVVVALIRADVLFPGPTPKPSGSISFPRHRESVDRAFTVDGTLSHISDSDHIWAAVQTGNLIYPKEPEIPSQDSHFSQEIVEPGIPSGATFSVVLLMVPSEGQRAIEGWLAKLRRGAEPPALQAIPGAAKLDAVQSLRMR